MHISLALKDYYRLLQMLYIMMNSYDMLASGYNSTFKFAGIGAPGWLSWLSFPLRLRSWSRGSWVRVPCQALCWQLRAWSLFQILSLPLPMLCSLSVSQKMKVKKIFFLSLNCFSNLPLTNLTWRVCYLLYHNRENKNTCLYFHKEILKGKKKDIQSAEGRILGSRS